jgi:hypothetical protein
MKLRRERRERRLGARFKTSSGNLLHPFHFFQSPFFFATTGLINRSIDKWFRPLPGDEILKNAISMERRYLRDEPDGNAALARTIARLSVLNATETTLASEVESHHLAMARVLNEDGGTVARS